MTLAPGSAAKGDEGRIQQQGLETVCVSSQVSLYYILFFFPILIDYLNSSLDYVYRTRRWMMNTNTNTTPIYNKLTLSWGSRH
jgi:hypothetical protein